MDDRDYYKILGLRKGVSLEQIKSRFRQLALRFHPDRNPEDPNAEEQFKLVAEAYHVLSNRQRRRLYDDEGHQGLKKQGYRGFKKTEDVLKTFASELFEFLGMPGTPSQRGPMRGADLSYELELSAEEATQGVNKDIEIIRMELCKDCQGRGAKTTSTQEVCYRCEGTGKYQEVSGIFTASGPCPHCGGKGTLRQTSCKSCSGQGRSQVRQSLQVNIPAGIENRTRIKIADEGDGGEPRGESGDLYLEIRVQRTS
jgi:molecular chaperone DnaJ